MKYYLGQIEIVNTTSISGNSDSMILMASAQALKD